MFVPVLCHAKFEWLIAESDEEAFCTSLKTVPRIDPLIHALPDDFVLKSIEVAAAPVIGYRVIGASFAPRMRSAPAQGLNGNRHDGM